jgi:hypothetical protein
MVGTGAVRHGRLRRRIVDNDGMRWWSELLRMNLTEQQYSDFGKSWPQKLGEVICQRDPSLNVERATELAWALRDACHG